ncbi:MAG: PspC domain-containing protein [Corynebacteriales bacterium]|nr:PspC domain-containing protein [Mycobacteriales bacterium]
MAFCGRVSHHCRLSCQRLNCKETVISQPAITLEPEPFARLYRRQSGRWVAGVGEGIGTHLRVPAWLIRLAFIFLMFFYGIGAVLYVVFWIALEVDPAQRGQKRSKFRVLPAALIFVATVGQLLIWRYRSGGNLILFASVAAVAAGAAVVWHQADPRQRQAWAEQMPRFPMLAMVRGQGGRLVLARLFVGGLLLFVGFVGIIAASGQLRALGDGLLFGSLTLVGVAIVAGPWLWNLAESLRTERTARIRSQERAEIAAIVHDKVMHTLALIQRNAQNPREVARLARGQERELRNWLYKPEFSPAERLTAALEVVVAEVEDTYAVSVESVLVGDATMTEPVGALVASAREALVNAAKHSGVQAISLYAETEQTQVSVFVRDRGTGFDADAIAQDRHGVRGSIVERMRRHGGDAEIRSTSELGTEVRLRMPLPVGAQQMPLEGIAND